MKTKILLLALMISLMAGGLGLAQDKQDKQPPVTAQPVDSDDELRKAIESSGGSETQIIKRKRDVFKE